MEKHTKDLFHQIAQSFEKTTDEQSNEPSGTMQVQDQQKDSPSVASIPDQGPSEDLPVTLDERPETVNSLDKTGADLTNNGASEKSNSPHAPSFDSDSREPENRSKNEAAKTSGTSDAQSLESCETLQVQRCENGPKGAEIPDVVSHQGAQP